MLKGSGFPLCLHPKGLAQLQAAIVCLFTLCRFHHIKSLTKRKHILAWGKELKLGGYSKPGYPGGLSLHRWTLYITYCSCVVHGVLWAVCLVLLL